MSNLWPQRRWVQTLAVALCVVVVGLAWFSYERFLSPTQIVLLDYPGFTAARIYKEVDAGWIDIQAIPMEQLEQAEGADLIVVFGRGLSLTPEQQSRLRAFAEAGTALFVESPTNPNMDVTNLSGEVLDRVSRYFDYGGSANYRHLLAYVRRVIDGKSIGAAVPSEPAPIPRDVLFTRGDDVMFDSVEAFEAHGRADRTWRDDTKKLALVTSVPGPFNANRDHLDAIIGAFETRGFNVYPIASVSKRLEFLQQISPDGVIYMPHGALTLGRRDAAIAWLERSSIPLFTPLSVFQRHDDWLADPQGFSGPLLTMNLVLAELDGGINPYATVAQFPDANGLEAFEAIPGRLERFVERVVRHLDLKTKPNADKRLAIVFFKGPGEGALSAGGLEVIPSLHRFLLRLKEAGYHVGDLPKDTAAFEEQIMTQAPLLAPYAQGDMARWLASGKPAWIDTSSYIQWCEDRLGAARCADIENKYGPPPGDYLSSSDGTKLAVARLRFGNVVVMPQPLPAVGKDTFRLVHGANVAPPYPYAGAYLWIQNAFQADGIIHFGTHGSLEFTPGKQVALSNVDWSDALIGDMPHFYVYTMNNVGEAIIAKRRSYTTILSHLSQPIAEAGLTDDLLKLRGELDQWRRAVGATKLERAKDIRKLAVSMDLLQALDLPAQADWDAQHFLTLSNFVERQENTRIALGLYTWGRGYADSAAVETAAQIVEGPLAAALMAMDRERGEEVTQYERDQAHFKTKYGLQAATAVQNLLDGADPQAVLATLLSESERQRMARLRDALARPDDASLVRGFIAMAQASASEAGPTVAFDRPVLMESLVSVLADPQKRELVETWRSEQQLQRSIDSLNPETRARAERIAAVIPAMKQALALTAEADMQNLLRQLQNPQARAVFVELLDDPDLAATVAAEQDAYLAALAQEALAPDKIQHLVLFSEAQEAAERLPQMSENELLAATEALQFYNDSSALPDAIKLSADVGDELLLLRDAKQTAQQALSLIARENSRREALDRSFLDVADRIQGLVINLPGRLDAIRASAAAERQAGLTALSGGFIAPSPGGDPVVAPLALPTGRNLVSLDAERTPSDAAWRVGGRLAEDLIAHYTAKHGTFPNKIAMTLWPNEFIQNEGSMVAQILHLIGAVPVRDPFGRVTDIRLADPATLSRPRIDVVVQTAGQFRDLAASRLYLINKAIALAAAEGDNPIAASTVNVERQLLDAGTSPLDARSLATERVFGGVNGNYGTGIMGFVENSATWDQAGEIGQQYIVNMNARYGSSEGWGKNTPGLFAAALSDTDAIVQPRSSNVNGPLSLDHMYEFMGGLSRATETVTGRSPEAYFNDYRTAGAASVATLADSVAEEMHGTLLNPKYITALREGGASSAATFAETFRNSFGWETMRPQTIGDESWNALFDVYVRDRYELDLRSFFEQNHPQSLQEITAVMLETVRKGFWDATAEQREQLASMHAELIATHGAGCSGFVCGNPQLRTFITEQLTDSAAQSYQAVVQQAIANPQAQEALVLSERDRANIDSQAPSTQTESTNAAQQTAEADDVSNLWSAALLAGLLLLGFAGLVIRARRRAV